MLETQSVVHSMRRHDPPATALYLGLHADAPHVAPARYRLSATDRVEIGRSEQRFATRDRHGGDETLTLGMCDVRMSESHARLSRTGEGWLVEDLGSKNGTWIGGQRIVRQALRDGDAIMAGHTVLVFRASGGEADDADELADAPRGLATLSPVLAARFAQLAGAAPTLVPIEITGESGTGKELVARAIHQLSGRPGRFIAVNCGALPSSLVEAELFGHRKGAFTGAGEERIGLVRSAHTGTLFLDEVGELPSSAQTALLRVLQESEVLPIGMDRAIDVDLRVVTATHRDLDLDVANHRFRADLRGRLLGLQLELPPLRERREDLGHLVATLLAHLAPGRAVTFTADAVAALYAHAWPFNIRELERALAAALAVARDRIELDHLPLNVRRASSLLVTRPPAAPVHAIEIADDTALRAALESTLRRHAGNLAAVSRELGKDRTQIRRWMKRLGLERPGT